MWGPGFGKFCVLCVDSCAQNVQILRLSIDRGVEKWLFVVRQGSYRCQSGLASIRKVSGLNADLIAGVVRGFGCFYKLVCCFEGSGCGCGGSGGVVCWTRSDARVDMTIVLCMLHLKMVTWHASRLLSPPKRTWSSPRSECFQILICLLGL
jgi:hypothetical protein